MHRESTSHTSPITSDTEPIGSDQANASGESIATRANKADMGRSVGGGSAGSYVPRPNWMEGKFFDAQDAKDGLINPDKGEVYFRPTEENHRPHSDRSYRNNAWAPAKDVHAGTVVSMPYIT